MKRSVSNDFCPRVEPRLLDKDVVRVRYIRTVRLPEAERKSLGLQEGVGYTEQDLLRARFYRAMEQLIARELREAKLTPLQQIGFEGRAPRVEYHPLPLENPERKYPRNVNASPLDQMFFKAKKKIELWQWVAGKRFEYDWRRSRSDGPVTVNYDPLALFATDSAKPKRQKGDPVVTFRPRGGRRVMSAPTVDDTRLDAIARLGRLAAEISNTGFWLLEHVIGHEWPLKVVAARLGVDERYVSERFREALTEAAGFYRLGPSLARLRTLSDRKRGQP